MKLPSDNMRDTANEPMNRWTTTCFGQDRLFCVFSFTVKVKNQSGQYWRENLVQPFHPFMRKTIFEHIHE